MPEGDAPEPLTLDVALTTQHRTVGTLLSRAVIDRFGADGLPDGTLTLRCRGTAGQSFGAFAAPGLTFELEGQANDYVGKGLSGATLAVRPPADARYDAAEAIVVGNVALYGATSGRLFVQGRAGERFAVRNSGAEAVVEGVGDHGCEYMTGGCVVVLGPTGRNFAAGMSGGRAYVYDPEGALPARCNRAMVDLDAVAPGSADAARLRRLLRAHHAATGSPAAARLLATWPDALGAFTLVMPRAFKAALAKMDAAPPDADALPGDALPSEAVPSPRSAPTP
jgi:glutamate synthase domain-containing protein 3